MGGEATAVTPHMRSRQGLWGGKAIPRLCLACEGRVGHRANISKGAQSSQPREAFALQRFCCESSARESLSAPSPTLLPSPDPQQGGRGAVWTPCAFMDCVTNTHKGKRQAGHQQSSSLKLWVLLPGCRVILIYLLPVAQ